MSTLGRRLREQRLAKGVELSRIAAETRISVRYLEALENEDVSTLPGSIFARSFARQYARYVGIDEREIEDDVQELFRNENYLPEPETPARIPILVPPLPEAVGAMERTAKRFPMAAAALVAVVALCSLVFVGWQKLREPDSARYEQDSSQSTTQQAPGAASESQQPADLIQTGNPAGGDVSGMALQITASQKTWVSISSDGHTVFSGILEANETRTFPGIERARMVVGNAGGLEVRTDGKSIGPIGPPGQVRVVLLSPDGSQILRRTKTAPEGDASGGATG